MHVHAETFARATRALREHRSARKLARVLHALQKPAAALWPFAELGVRLALAQVFLVSGLLKLADWPTALRLATFEYPVDWLAPATAAVLGVTAELLGGILLAAGLATRAAAVALIALTLVIDLEYRALAEHRDWLVLLGGWLLLGAGPLSLDRLLARGLSSSALPGAARLQAGLAAVSAAGEAPWLLVVRGWLAWRVLDTQWPGFSGAPLAGAWPCLLGAALVLAGLGTRLFAPALLLIFAAASLPDFGWLAGLALLLALRGAGAWSLDGLIAAAIERRAPRLSALPDEVVDGLPQVVVVGAGFGGLAVARGLAEAPCRVTVVDKRNHHLFQPLLYQVATATLDPSDIATPIRELLRTQDNARVRLGEAAGVDRDARRLRLADGSTLPYDFLVLATGARHSYFGRDDWEPYAPGLKQIDDATAIRRRILLAFERAETSTDPVERARLLTFVIVGGGPTGVELAGSIAELAHHGLSGEFRHIDPAAARVILIQADARVLPAFPEVLSARAQRDLERLGVEVLTSARVEAVDADGVLVSGTRIGARAVFWAAGVMASPAAQWLGLEADRAGRVPVAADLSVEGWPGVYAIGDTAASLGWNGRPVPGLAPAAKQGGAYVATAIRARLEGRDAPAPFRYVHQGSLATIGRQSAIADFGRVRLAGGLAWWLWGAVHVAFLAQLRSRVSVAISWFWAYLTFRRGTRLVTGGDG
ncbi:NAD(P)/FAD-dependent oxidoreductase [Plasticicumulans sp.]|uniref:NAD(P)/FAD-dependent oxidoreductase n=2 Tax=Plasticicumulans sp. TaxID=2307179 RepID=UPI00321F6170